MERAGNMVKSSDGANYDGFIIIGLNGTADVWREEIFSGRDDALATEPERI